MLCKILWLVFVVCELTLSLLLSVGLVHVSAEWPPEILTLCSWVTCVTWCKNLIDFNLKSEWHLNWVSPTALLDYFKEIFCFNQLRPKVKRHKICLFSDCHNFKFCYSWNCADCLMIVLNSHVFYVEDECSFIANLLISTGQHLVEYESLWEFCATFSEFFRSVLNFGSIHHCTIFFLCNSDFLL